MKKINRFLITLLLIVTAGSGKLAAQCTISTGTTSSGSAGVTATSLTISHTTVSGGNRILVVRTSTTNADPTSIKYNNIDLTKLASQNRSSQYASIWYLVNPPVGTFNVIISGSSGFTPIAGATSFTGVHQTTPFGNTAASNFSGVNPSVTVNSASGELVIDVVNENSFQLTVGSGQTQQFNVHEHVYWGSGSSEAGASSVTMSWSGFSPSGAILAAAMKPCVTIVADAGADKEVCAGSQVAIGGSPTGSGGVEPYTYAWSPAAGLSSTSSSNPNANPSSTTTYTVTVTDNTGASNTDAMVVTVNALPNANAGSDKEFCVGSSVSIGGSPTGSGGTGPYTYSWSPSTGLSSTTVANPDANPTSTTTYTVTVTDNKGCTKTDAVLVTVNALPNADAGSDKEVCPGSSVAIGGSPTGSGGTGPYTYNWSPSTGLSSTTVANPNANPATATTYTVTVTDNKGCTKTDAVLVSVNSLPDANAGSDKQICNGSTVAIGGSPTGSGGTGPYTYSWSPSAGLNSTTVANPNANPTSTTTYTVMVTDNKGCTKTDAVLVTVNLLPNADAGADKTICIDSTTVIGGSPTGSGGTGPYTYSWNPSTALSSTTVANPSANPAVTISYTVTVTDNKGCTKTDVVVVTVDQSAVTLAAQPGTTVCQGQAIAFTATPGNYGYYEFYKNNSLVQAGASNTWQLASPATGDVVKVKVIDDSKVDTVIVPCTGNIQINSTTSGSAGITATSLTISHSVSGSNRLLVVRAITNDADPTNVKFNNVDLTKLATHNRNNDQYVSIWYMVNPPAGTYNVVITGASGFTPIAGVTSFTGVHQTTPFGAASGNTFNGSNPSITISSATGELVIDVVNENVYSLTVGSGQTQQFNLSEHVYEGMGSSEPGASSVTMSWSGFSPTGAHLAVPIKPAACPNDTDIVITGCPFGESDDLDINAPAIVDLSGTFTIGGTSPNFATITDALNDLNTCKHVVGRVIYKIRDGNYNESIILPSTTSYTKAHDTIPIVFAAENTDSPAVNISANENVVLLDNKEYIFLTGLTLKTTESNKNAVNISSSDHVLLLNCEINSTSTGNVAILSNSVSHLEVNETTIRNYKNGVVIPGPQVNNSVINSDIEVTELALSMTNQQDAAVTGNILKTTATSSVYAVNMQTCSGTIPVSGNTIQGQSGALFMANHNAITDLSNNMVVAENGTGIYIQSFAGDLTLSENKVTASADGIKFKDNTSAADTLDTLSGKKLLFFRNTISCGGEGINLFELRKTDIQLLNNHVESSHTAFVAKDMETNASGAMEIVGNLFKGNERSVKLENNAIATELRSNTLVVSGSDGARTIDLINTDHLKLLVNNAVNKTASGVVTFDSYDPTDLQTAYNNWFSFVSSSVSNKPALIAAASNRSVNPQFAGVNDYKLTVKSPLLNQVDTLRDTLVFFDLFENPRFLPYDIGAIESERTPLDGIQIQLVLDEGDSFTPDGDNSFDRFEIQGLNNYTNIQVKIFDRFGTMIFETTDAGNFWNGVDMNTQMLVDEGSFRYELTLDSQTIGGFVYVAR